MHTNANLKDKVHEAVVGDPEHGVAGIQDDLWTNVIPDIRKSHGSWLFDAGAGRELLDFKSFFATSVVSYNHPRILEKAFMERLAWAGVQKPSLSDMWPEEMGEFVETFRRVAVPQGMRHLFFVEGGGLGVENTLKAAFDWKVRLNIAKGLIKSDPQEERKPLGTRVIGFEEAFHGRTGYTLALTHTADPRKYKYFPKLDWFRVTNPKLRFPVIEEALEEVKRKEDTSLNEIKSILKEHPHDIAAIIIEPIQAEGGDNHLRPEFFAFLKQLADENDIMLIYDEVQTGLGTTGKMWCYQHFGPEAAPDMVAFGKKVQLGGMMASGEKLSRIKENVFAPLPEGKSRLNSTWGGNLVDMVRSTRILQIMEEENLVENAAAMGETFLAGLRNLAEMFPGLVNNPRGRGLMLAVDAATPDLRGKIWQAFFDEGLLCLTCGRLGVRFRPHLDVTEEDIKKGLDIMAKALGKLKE